MDGDCIWMFPVNNALILGLSTGWICSACVKSQSPNSPPAVHITWSLNSLRQNREMKQLPGPCLYLCGARVSERWVRKSVGDEKKLVYLFNFINIFVANSVLSGWVEPLALWRSFSSFQTQIFGNRPPHGKYVHLHRRVSGCRLWQQRFRRNRHLRTIVDVCVIGQQQWHALLQCGTAVSIESRYKGSGLTPILVGIN